jgi:CCR4-NOT transcription complex subunit 1
LRIKPFYFKEHPQLIQLIKLSIEKSVNEWISPVIERAIKIAVTTCEQIVKKVATVA